MGTAIDIAGQRFGMLLALRPTDERKDKKVVWEFLCECGKKTKALAKSAKSGNTKSCGCLALKTSRIRSESLGLRVELDCPQCKKNFSVKKSHVHRSRYCSKDCQNEAQKTTMANEGNPNWKGGISFDDDYLKSRAKSWRDKNLNRISSYNRRGKMKRKQVEGRHTPEDISTIYDLQRGRCAYCSVKVFKKYHVDHVTPISKGGTNAKENLCISCPTCNLKKWAMDPIEWANKIGKLI